MSRHRNVRSLNYEEECDGYDEIYGHSVEDDFCVSPSTAAEFMYDRSQQQQHVLSTFMKKEHEPNIPEEECENDTDDNSLQDSSSFIKPALNDVQQAQLYSCLEEIRSVLGDSTPEHILTDAVVKADFNCEKALDTILCQQEAPKPQREPRKKRDRDDFDSLNSSPSPDSPLPDFPPPCIGKMVGTAEQVGHGDCVASVSDVLDKCFETESPKRGCPVLNMTHDSHKLMASVPPAHNSRPCSNLPSEGNQSLFCENVSKPGSHDPDSERACKQLSVVSSEQSICLGQLKSDVVTCADMSHESVSVAASTQVFASVDAMCSGMQSNRGNDDKKLASSEAIDRNIYNDVTCSEVGDQMIEQSEITGHELVCTPSADSSPKLESCTSKPYSLSQLAANCQSSPNSQSSSSKPFSLSQLAANCGSPPNSQSSSSKSFSLSQLAANCQSSPNSQSSSKPFSLSQLAANCGSPPNSQSSSSKPFSLSQLAANCGTPPKSHNSYKPINLSQLAAGCNNPQTSHTSSSPITLSQLAARCGTPPKSQPSSFKPISLSELAADCGTPQKSPPSSKPISLSELAAGLGSPPNSSLSASSVSFSHLATECESPRNSHTLSKPLSLSSLAADGGVPTNSGPSFIQNQVKFGDVFSHLKSDNETGSNSDLACKQTSFSRLAADCRTTPTTTRSLENPPVMSPQVLSLDTLAALSGVKPPPGFKQAMQNPLCTTARRAPPGFETCAPKPQFSFNLSDLAAKHEVHVAKLKSEKVHRSVVVPAAVPVARPSLFAKILCSNYTPIQNSMHKVGSGKFCFNRQASGKKRAEQVKRHIEPFDFSTPSPDDIVKTKQKAAFGNSYRTRVSADKIPAVDLEAKPAIKLSDPVPRVVAASGGDVTQGVARMTFSAGKHATMGFAEPEKNPETKDKEKMVKEAVTSNNINDDAVEKAPVTATETLKKDVTDAAVPKSVTRSKQEKLQVQKIYDKRKADNKAHLNLVVIGHVDAGKSTLMGHVLYQLGFVNKKVMHKHEQEAKKMGKASFAYAWVLDETEEERSRGVTMDIAQTRFETDTKVVTLLDAPGHKDFIPNMITGAAQADVAILVVNATRGEFETGFDMGGQTREHAMLIRSLGVSQLLVAVNKMDTVDWSKTRYDEIVKKLGTFLKQAGFKEADVSYVPCSGLIGENLTKPSNIPELCSWYHGPCVVQHIDKFRPPERLIDKPLRLSVTDIFKGQGAGFSVAGTIQAGCVQPADKVLVMPQGELATVKGILVDDAPAQIAFAGDSVILTLVGIEMTNIAIGSIVCDRNEPIRASTRFQARIVIFNIDLPITKGFPVEIHYQSLTEPGQVRRLISQLHKSTGEVIKKKPRCLVKNSNAVVEIEVERPICVELYRDYKDLGRVMLRSGGHTIAAGLVTEVVNGKKNN